MSGMFAVDTFHHQRPDHGVIVSYQLGQGSDLLLLHDMAGSARYWGELLTHHVLDQYRVTVLDQRGHGNAAHGTNYHMDAFIADACAVVHERALTRSIVIGHGLGAMQAVCVAQRMPELVRGLVLLDPPWFDEPVSVTEIAGQQATLQHQLHTWQQMSAERRVQTISEHSPHWSPVAIESWSDARVLCDNRAVAWMSAYATPVAEQLALIQHPVLLLSGDVTRGAYLSERMGALVKATLRTCEYVHIAEVGHDIHHDRPQAYLRAFRRFLRTLAP
jgi:pimeloyl-ACP methyl ester carboxylesterase